MTWDWLPPERLLLTVAVFVGVLLIRHLSLRYIRKRYEILTAKNRSDMSVIHNGSVAILVVFLFSMWLPQIEQFALSITAIAVALVIATKELLMCLVGGILIRTSGAFVIGDWITIDQRFGEVIERNVLTLTLQEIEPRRFTYTGRTITLPNSLMLTLMVTNQNFLRRYQFHTFSITIEPDAFPIDMESKLQERIEGVVASFSETARRYAAMLEKRTGIDIPGTEPSIDFSTNELAKLVTTISVFCPIERTAELEKAMMREFIGWYRSNRVK